MVTAHLIARGEDCGNPTEPCRGTTIRFLTGSPLKGRGMSKKTPTGTPLRAGRCKIQPVERLFGCPRKTNSQHHTTTSQKTAPNTHENSERQYQKPQKHYFTSLAGVVGGLGGSKVCATQHIVAGYCQTMAGSRHRKPAGAKVALRCCCGVFICGGGGLCGGVMGEPQGCGSWGSGLVGCG